MKLTVAAFFKTLFLVKPEQCMKMLKAFMCQCAKVFLS